MSLLQNMRSKAKGIVAKALIALLIVAMAAFGLDAFFYNQQSGSNNVLTINGRGVTEAEVENSVFQYRQQIASQFGQDYVEQIPEAAINEGGINNLTRQILLLQQAENYQLTASDEAVQQTLAATPEFRSENGFNREAFVDYLQANSLTSQQLRENVRESITLQTLPNFASQASFSTEKEKDLIAGIVYQSRDLMYTRISYAEFEPLAQPSAEDIQAHYDANKERYQSQEQASFEYLIVDRNNISEQIGEPDEEAINLAYQSHLAELSDDKRYGVSHILVDLSSRDEKEAKIRATQAKEEIDSGTPFNDIVAEYSDDPESKSKNGSLGTINLDDFIPELNDQIKLMSEGDIAGPFLSSFGYHIIRLDAEPGSNKPSLEELRETLTKQLIAKQASDLYERKKIDLGNSTFSSADLTAPATELAIAVQETDFIPRTGSENTKDLFANQKVIEAGFSQEVLTENLNSQVIDLGDKAVVLRLKEHKPKRQLQIDEVESEVRDTLISSESKKMAIELAQKILAKVHENGDQQDAELLSDSIFLDTLADLTPQSIKLVWSTDKGVKSFGQQNVDPEIADVTFALKDKSVLQQEVQPAHVYLGLITNSQKPLFSDLKKEEQEGIEQELRKKSSSQHTSALYALLKNKASISRRDETSSSH